MIQVASSMDVFLLLKEHFNPWAEEIWSVALDTQLRPLAVRMIFRGTVNACQIHSRDIFRFAITHNASSFILAHNHPSGDPTPSHRDLLMTQKIVKISKLLEIPMHDHLIFTDTKYFSMADQGLLSKKVARIRRIKKL